LLTALQIVVCVLTEPLVKYIMWNLLLFNEAENIQIIGQLH